MIKFAKEMILEPIVTLLEFVFGQVKISDPVLIPIKTANARVRRKL